MARRVSLASPRSVAHSPRSEPPPPAPPPSPPPPARLGRVAGECTARPGPAGREKLRAWRPCRPLPEGGGRPEAGRAEGPPGEGEAPPGSPDGPGGPFRPRAPPEHPAHCAQTPVPSPPPGASGRAVRLARAWGAAAAAVTSSRIPHAAWLEPSRGPPPWARLGCGGRGWGGSVPGRGSYFWPALSLGDHLRQALPERGAPPQPVARGRAVGAGSVSGSSLPGRPGTPGQAQVCGTWGFHTPSVLAVCACFSFQAAATAAWWGKGQ